MIRLSDSSYRSRASVWMSASVLSRTESVIRYGSEDFNDIDHADNNLANGFIGFLVLVVILILIAQ